MEKDYYELLNVKHDVTIGELKKAYYSKARKLHPDKNQGKEEETTEKFKNIQEAYQILSNPHKRCMYDLHCKLPKESFSQDSVHIKYLFLRFQPIPSWTVSQNFAQGMIRGTLGIIGGTCIVGAGLLNAVVISCSGYFILTLCLQPILGVVPTMIISVPVTSFCVQAGITVAKESIWRGLEIFGISIMTTTHSLSYLGRNVIQSTRDAVKLSWNSMLLYLLPSLQQTQTSTKKTSDRVRFQNEEWILIND